MRDIRLAYQGSQAGMIYRLKQFGRPLQSAGTLNTVTNVEVEEYAGEPYVVWKFGEPGDLQINKDEEVFDAFLDLVDPTPKQTARFVSRFGPLPICPHGYYESWCPNRLPERCGQWVKRQPAWWYVQSAGVVRSILHLAAAAHQGQAGRENDWVLLETVDGELTTPPSTEWSHTVGALRPVQTRTAAAARHVVQQWVNHWLVLGEVALWFDWAEGGRSATFELFGPNVVSAVAQQLAFAVARAGAIATCTGCGRPFVAARKRGAKRGAWCDRCGKRARDRFAKRKQRERDSGMTP